MKLTDVPQQADALYEGETKLVYAVNESGKLQGAATSGWEAEIIALKDAVDELSQQAQQAYERVLAGASSPLEYHMYANRMDLPMLAQAMGRFQWQVKRHFHPQRFAKLSDKTRQAYASVLGISVTQLNQLPDLRAQGTHQ